MTFRGPYQLLISPSLLNSMAVEVNIDTTGSFFRFLNTLGLSFEIHFLSFFLSTSVFLSPPLVIGLPKFSSELTVRTELPELNCQFKFSSGSGSDDSRQFRFAVRALRKF